MKHLNWYSNWSESKEVENPGINSLKWWNGQKVDVFRNCRLLPFVGSNECMNYHFLLPSVKEIY